MTQLKPYWGDEPCMHGRKVAEDDEPCDRPADRAGEDETGRLVLCGKHYQDLCLAMRYGGSQRSWVNE